jgi:hypothetical protein
MTERKGYINSLYHCALLLVAGAILQLCFGPLDRGFLAYPWGVIIALNYLYLLILAYAKADRWKWVKRLYDHYASVAALAMMVVVSMVMGFVRIMDTWVFALAMLHFTTVMGLCAIDDVYNWKKGRLVPKVAHVALFIILFAGVFGSGDKQRLIVRVEEGKSVHLGMTREHKAEKLPFTLTLEDFSVEYYPSGEPKRYLSKVELKPFDAEEKKLEIEVNKPGKYKAWRIYQNHYELGEKDVSIFECVKDSWYSAVWIALWGLICAGCGMFFSVKKKKKE